MPTEIEEFFAEFEATGEDEVRMKLASQRVYGAYKKEAAAEWLRQKDQEHADTFNREQISIARDAAAAARDSADAARDAADAARDSADEAKEANRVAKHANTIANIAIAVAIIAATASIINVVLY